MKADREEVSLKDYVDNTFAMHQKAIDVARVSMEKRLEGMNEFRATLKDQASNFVTKQEHDSVISDIRELRDFKSNMEGKASQLSVIIAYGISILSLSISLFKIFFR